VSAHTLVVDALLTGRSLAALTTALELAEVGLRVAIPPAAPDDEAAELDAGGERDPEGTIAQLLERVAAPIGAGTAVESDAPVDERCLPVYTAAPVPWIQAGNGTWSPQATPSIFGIPAEPLAPEVSAVLGSGGAVRMYLDRVLPVLTIGKTQYLGKLVRRRFGRRALAVLTTPIIQERFGVSPDAVEVAIAAPGLNEALTRGGALSVAVRACTERHEERERLVRPAAGWAALRESLLRRLENFGSVTLPESPVAYQAEGEGWSAELPGADTTVIARALVGDRPRDPRRDGVSPVAEVVSHSGLRVAERVYAETEILDAELRDALVEHRAVGVVVSGQWSLRFEPAETDRRADARPAWRVRLVGPRQAGADADSDATADSDVAVRLGQVLEAAGVTARPGSSWQVHHRAAPYLGIAERDEARHALESWVLHEPLVLLVGRVQHGDDLGRAIAFAHETGIALRRRLLGLTEGE